MKATVKKTVRWTVFREGVDASIIAYLCLTSEVGSSVRRKYVTHNHNKKYISTSLFLYTTSNRVTGLEEFEEVHLCTTINDHVVLGVKKTVRWTVFREGVEASILSYLCL